MINIFKILHCSHDGNTFYTRLMMDICFVDLGPFYTSFFFYLREVNTTTGMPMNPTTWGQRTVWKWTSWTTPASGTTAAAPRSSASSVRNPPVRTTQKIDGFNLQIKDITSTKILSSSKSDSAVLIMMFIL